MTRVKLIISACIIGVLTGCSYMNLETESPAGVSIADDGPVSVNAGDDLSYYPVFRNGTPISAIS